MFARTDLKISILPLGPHDMDLKHFWKLWNVDRMTLQKSMRDGWRVCHEGAHVLDSDALESQRNGHRVRELGDRVVEDGMSRLTTTSIELRVVPDCDWTVEGWVG